MMIAGGLFPVFDLIKFSVVDLSYQGFQWFSPCPIWFPRPIWFPIWSPIEAQTLLGSFPMSNLVPIPNLVPN